MPILPSVISVLDADITGFVSKMNTATQKMDAVDQLSVGFSKRQAQAASMGIMAGGALVTGAGAVLVGVSDQIEKNQATLRQEIENTGRSWDDYKGRIDAATNSEAHFGKGEADTLDALGILTVAYKDPTKALGELSLVTDLAAKKHMTLTEAANMVAKAHLGGTRALKDMGVNYKDSTTLVHEAEIATKAHETAVTTLTRAQQALSDLEARDAGVKKLSISQQQALAKAHDAVTAATAKEAVTGAAAVKAEAASAGAAKNIDEAMAKAEKSIHGVAEAQANTFGGKMDEYRTLIMNMTGAVGKSLGPALTILGPILMGVGGAMQFFTMVTWAGVASVWAFLWPILAVIAVLAVVTAGLIYTYTHVKWFRDAVNFAWKEIQILWGWLSNNFVPVITVVGRVIGDLVGQQLKNFVDNMTVLGNVVGGAWHALQNFGSFADGAFRGMLSGLSGPLKAVADLFNLLNPFAHHSPSLVENVQAGVDQIKGHYMSLSGMQLAGPSLGGITAGSTARGLGGFAMAGAGGGGGINVYVTVQGSIVSQAGIADQLAPLIRESLLRSKRSTGNLGLA